jgi:hypothetical protein
LCRACTGLSVQLAMTLDVGGLCPEDLTRSCPVGIFSFLSPCTVLAPVRARRRPGSLTTWLWRKLSVDAQPSSTLAGLYDSHCCGLRAFHHAPRGVSWGSSRRASYPEAGGERTLQACACTDRRPAWSLHDDGDALRTGSAGRVCVDALVLVLPFLPSSFPPFLSLFLLISISRCMIWRVGDAAWGVPMASPKQNVHWRGVNAFARGGRRRGR